MSDNNTEWKEVIEHLQDMTLEELEAFVPVVEALGRAKTAGFLFSDFETIQ